MDNSKINILNNAVASVEIEGYKLSDDEKAICYGFICGDISKADFINTILERCNA